MSNSRLYGQKLSNRRRLFILSGADVIARFRLTRTQKPIRKVMEEALLRVGKDPVFRKNWEDVVPEGNAFERMLTGKEVLEDMKVYTDWRPKIMSMYRRRP